MSAASKMYLCLMLLVFAGAAKADYESAGCSDEGCGIPCYLKAADDDCHYTNHDDSCDGGGTTELDQQLWLLNDSLVRLQEKLIQKGIIPTGKTCPPLSIIDNGGVIYTDLLLSIGVIANYVCNPGYSLHGHGRYECSVDSVWIDNDTKEPITQVPTCEDSLITCEALVPIPFGHVSYQIVDAMIVQPGDVATYSCDTLFTLQGADHRICLRNGTWSGEEPVCLAPPTEANNGSTSHRHQGSSSSDVKVSVGILVPLAIILAAAVIVILVYVITKRKRQGYFSLGNNSKPSRVTKKEKIQLDTETLDAEL